MTGVGFPARGTRPRSGRQRGEQRRHRHAALVALLMAPFMAMFDMFVVNIAAPSIESGLQTGFAGLQLVVSGYIVAFAMGLVTGGRLGDLLGHRRTFVVGMGCFAVTSAACAAAPSIQVLVAVRLLQGLSGALMLPQVLALVQVLFRPEERRRVLGLYGAAMSGGSIAGQVLGGLLIRFDVIGLGWRTVFLVNVPLALAAVVGALIAVPRLYAPAAGVRFDPVGVLLLSVAVPLLLCPLMFGAENGWPLWVWPLLAASGAVFWLFVRWEARVPGGERAALLPLRLFRLPQFALGLPTAAAFYCGNSSFYLVLAFYLQDGIRLTPLAAALTFLPLGVAFAIASLASRSLAQRFGGRLLSWGAACVVLGLLLLIAGVGDHHRAAQALLLQPGLILCGTGQGLVLPSLLATVLHGVDTADAGAASGVVLTASQVSGALGVAGVGAVFRTMLDGYGYDTAFRAGLVALGAVGVVTFVLLRRLAPRADAQPETAAVGSG